MIQKFEFHETKITELIEITPFYSDDIRGCFIKDYSKDIFEANGIIHNLSEVFYAISHKGVIRGLHFQREKQQAKLVRCISGHIYDVVVDLRPKSLTFQKWLGFDLTGENHKSILIPGGCAHGYLTLQPSIVSYQCNEKFYSEFDDGIRWNDPDIGIDWGLEQVGGAERIILSEKDKNLQYFREFMTQYGGLE